MLLPFKANKEKKKTKTPIKGCCAVVVAGVAIGLWRLWLWWAFVVPRIVVAVTIHYTVPGVVGVVVAPVYL